MVHMVASLFFMLVALAAAGLTGLMLAEARGKMAAALGLSSTIAVGPAQVRRVRARARVVSVSPSVRVRAAA